METAILYRGDARRRPGGVVSDRVRRVLACPRGCSRDGSMETESKE